MNRSELESLRQRIIAQADAKGNDGWLMLPVPSEVRANGTLRVPRGAFEHWAVHLAHGSHLATPWVRQSPVGVKQGADDPFHTDWMLGAGLDPLDMHIRGDNPTRQALSDAAYAARSEVERRLLNHECSVLLPGPDIEGIVVPASTPGAVDWSVNHDGDGERRPPILVLRSAGPEWLDDVLAALERNGAVVVERGGEMSHLVMEARASGVGPILRRDQARSLYPVGTVLKLSPDAGAITLVEQTRPIVHSEVEPWLPEEPVIAVSPTSETPAPPTAAPNVVLTPEAKAFGFAVAGRGTLNQFSHMQPAYKVEGRDYQAYASYHWSRNLFSGDKNSSHLVVHVGTKPGSTLPHRKVTLVSDCRQWPATSLSEAVHAALYSVAPAEHPESPETEKLRQSRRDAEHEWWLSRTGTARKTDAELLESARSMLRDRDAFQEESGVPRDVRDDRASRDMLSLIDEEYFDTMASYRHCERHYDIEFKRRGMVETIWRLEGELEDELVRKRPELTISGRVH